MIRRAAALSSTTSLSRRCTPSISSCSPASSLVTDYYNNNVRRSGSSISNNSSSSSRIGLGYDLNYGGHGQREHKLLFQVVGVGAARTSPTSSHTIISRSLHVSNRSASASASSDSALHDNVRSTLTQNNVSSSLAAWRSSLNSIWTQFRNFPNGAKTLYQDCLTYRNIEEASRSPRNAWTKAHTNNDRHNDQNKNKHWSHLVPFDPGYTSRPGSIPRRQYEHQRRVLHDVAACGPIVALWLLPVVGSAFVLVGVASPRLLLSRQFHTENMKEEFRALELQQRETQYENLLEMLRVRRNGDDDTTEETPASLLTRFTTTTTTPSSSSSSITLNSLPRRHLTTLALAAGVLRFHDVLNAALVLYACPSPILRWRLRSIAGEIARDDKLLLQEDDLHNLTDDEAAAACALRGLDHGRSGLQDYLRIVRALDEQQQLQQQEDREVVHKLDYETWESFVLHLPALLRRNNNNNNNSS